MTCVGEHSQIVKYCREKLQARQGVVGTAVTVSCRLCVSSCVVGWVIVIVYVFSLLLSSSFSLPLVGYVGVVTISRVNGGSVGP